MGKQILNLPPDLKARLFCARATNQPVWWWINFNVLKHNFRLELEFPLGIFHTPICVAQFEAKLITLLQDNRNGSTQLKTGEILKRFNAKDGRNVILRTPKWEDLDGLLELINSLVDEKAEILITQKFTREEEAEWLTKALLRLEKDEVFFLTAEVDEEIVSSSDLQLRCEGQEYLGFIGIIVKNGYRNLGIGSEIMKTHFEKAALFGLKVLAVNVFATNKRAIHVYEKVGFVQADRISKKHFRQGKFIDEVIMKKLI